MRNKVARFTAYTVLALLFAYLLTGSGYDWLITSTSIAALSSYILLIEFDSRSRDSRRVALAGVLVALTVASRQLLHGIEFSPVFFIVILTGYVYGFTFGFAVGALSMFTSNFFLGHGPWTAFQMFSLGLCGALAALIPTIKRFETHVLVFYSVFAAYLYGCLMDVFSWVAFVPTHTFNSFVAVLSAGLIPNTARALGNIFFMSLIGPVLLRAMRRFAKRLTFERH